MSGHPSCLSNIWTFSHDHMSPAAADDLQTRKQVFSGWTASNGLRGAANIPKMKQSVVIFLNISTAADKTKEKLKPHRSIEQKQKVEKCLFVTVLRTKRVPPACASAATLNYPIHVTQGC